MVTNVHYRAERPEDQYAIAEVHRLAFGQESEGSLVEALRREGFSRISEVAERHDTVIGHVLFSVMWIDTPRGSIEALSLAPMGILPRYQNQGIGSGLLLHALACCRQAGHRIVLVLGHPTFYGKAGFSAQLAKSLESPFPGDSFMALELVPGSLTGIQGSVRYSQPFDDL